MEHQADLIAIAYAYVLSSGGRLISTTASCGDDYSRFHSYLSGGTAANAERFFRENGLTDFLLRGLVDRANRAVGDCMVSEEIDKQHRDPASAGGPGRTRYPDECYLPLHGQYYGMIMSTRVIDFSNPLTVKLERERASCMGRTGRPLIPPVAKSSRPGPSPLVPLPIERRARAPA